MSWYSFLYWFVYRFVLASLAHFNWFMAVYTNCIYFTFWKSYDLMWFWMHLVLCSCFQSLRRENYLIVWCNLIIKGRTTYPNHTYKEIYLGLYGAPGTKSERALRRMDTVEVREREQRRSRRTIRRQKGVEDSSSDSEDDAKSVGRTSNAPPTQKSVSSPRLIPDIVAEHIEEEDAFNTSETTPLASRKIPEQASSPTLGVPMRPPRPSRPISSCDDLKSKDETSSARVQFNIEEGTATEKEKLTGGDSGDETGTGKWMSRVPDIIKNRFKKETKPPPPTWDLLPDRPDDEDRPDSVATSTTTWSKFKEFIPNPFNRSVSNMTMEIPTIDGMELLYPTFSNAYDIKDPKKRKKREKRDRKALTVKVRRRIREELEEAAALEKKRRKIADALELMLQLLRMITSFAVLIGNIRKTFIPAQFKYLKHGQHAYDNYELIWIFRVTTFIDIAMFWLSVMYVYCLQWNLCCRLGFFRFWFWAIVLGTIATTVMFIPMTFVMEQLDLSWCRFNPESPLAKYQPSWGL